MPRTSATACPLTAEMCCCCWISRMRRGGGVVVGLLVGVAVGPPGVTVAGAVPVAVGDAVAVAVAAAHAFAVSGLGENCAYVVVLRRPPEPLGQRWFELMTPLPPVFSSTCGWP